jgi:predicted ester cyclase
MHRDRADSESRFAVALSDFNHEEDSMNDTYKAITRRLVEGLFTADVAVVDELVDENIVSHCPGRSEPLRGRDAYRGVALDIPLTEPHLRVEDQIAQGDRVATRWTFAGRHDQELLGMPPTGRTVGVADMMLHRIDEGQVVEEWLEIDLLGLLGQLGTVPEATTASA